MPVESGSVSHRICQTGLGFTEPGFALPSREVRERSMQTGLFPGGMCLIHVAVFPRLAAVLPERGSDDSGSSRVPVVKPVLGEAITNECIDWGELPPASNMGNTHGVCELRGRTTLTQPAGSSDTMVVFDMGSSSVVRQDFKGSAPVCTSAGRQYQYLYLRHLRGWW